MSDQTTQNYKILKPLQKLPCDVPPIWLMRQAGRYLPEYRELRATAGSFLELCYSPKFATEVTLQPIRRFGFDASILFSDILVVPHALGQHLEFVEGEGPRLDPIKSESDLLKLNPEGVSEKFNLVYEAVSSIRAALPTETALIGFCGAPWTVATYMIGGRGSVDQATTRQFAYQHPETFDKLINLLVDISVQYLLGQVKAGVNILQIFDSWAGNLPDDEFQKWSIDPTTRIVREIKSQHPNIPIIGFPRGAGPGYKNFMQTTKVDGVSCDTSLPLSYIRDELAPLGAVQGNLDPLLLVSGGDALNRRVDEIIETMAGKPFIFNLGHGIVPQTPIENVTQLVNRIRRNN